MVKHNKNIPRNWLKQRYWYDKVTIPKLAKRKKVSKAHICRLINEYGLKKKENGIKQKGRDSFKMSESQKALIKKMQTSRKEVIVHTKKGSFVGIYESLREVSRELGIDRRNITRCLRATAPASTGGYTFKLKRYKGEIITYRRDNLDFSLDIEKISNGLTAQLPKYPQEERIFYYNRKLRQVWKNLNYIKGKGKINEKT